MGYTNSWDVGQMMPERYTLSLTIPLIFLKVSPWLFLPSMPRTRKSASHWLWVTEDMQKLGIERKKIRLDLISGPVFRTSMVPLGEHRSWHHELNSPGAQFSHLCNRNNYTLFLRIQKSASSAWYHPWHIWGTSGILFLLASMAAAAVKNRRMHSLLLTPSLFFCGHFYLPRPLKIKEVLFERKTA